REPPPPPERPGDAGDAGPLPGAGEAGSLSLLHRERGIWKTRPRPRLPRLLLGNDHFPRGRQHPRRRRGPAARRDARRDRHPVSGPGAAPRQGLRAGLRRRDGKEARPGQGRGPRDGRRGNHREFRAALPPPVSASRISRQEFEKCVDEALTQVPGQFRKYLENIVIVVEEEPLEEDYDETDTPDEDELFGIFRG